MKKEDCFQLGHISKTHGYKGELIFLSNGENLINFTEQESVFIEINGQLIPFIIDSIHPSGNFTAIVRLRDINIEEKARALVKCRIFIPLSMLPKQKAPSPKPVVSKAEPFQAPNSKLKGFKVIDDTHGEIGEVKSILEICQQLLLEIKNGTKEILIPANEEIIYKIDKKNKTIYINAPEGLIDIYLGNKT
ncbi:MAG: ribosome maturation factor RimM [Bacteroidales bacterium]